MNYPDKSAERSQRSEAQSYAKAMLNILADFSEEKTRLQDTQRAILNILDDSADEKTRLDETQRAVLNILDDANDETVRLRTTQRAMLNILEDVDAETNERKMSEERVRVLNRNLEASVVQRTAALTEAINDMEGFSYSVSHDLRTPLRAIDGFSQQLLKRYADKLDDEGKRYLNVVRDNTKKMSQLIDDILDFSRMGRLNISMSEVNMDGLAREVFEELRPNFAGRELTMEIKPLPPVHGDQAMLRQVWVNLLGNAIKFTQPRAAALVEVGGHAEGAENIFYVKDNGAGFNMQYADKLFGVFQRLHGNEEFEGTGIGLAIVKRIVTRHDGRVWAEGRVDEGATFYFTSPI